ncbi:MAG: YaiI/YqxD family protein [Spirochaetes bacterium]|nr:YaiI/YqxD family protein [Spirochaetota bacterium]
MRILVDADSCPVVIKEILYRAAERLRIPLVLVANQYLSVPGSVYISCIEVPAGPDIADDRIVDMVETDDLVISADLPLADRVIAKGGFALNPRGDLYTAENIKDRLATRDLMDLLRQSGMDTGGPSSFSQKDRQAFANQLDRFLVKHGHG